MRCQRYCAALAVARAASWSWEEFRPAIS